MWPANSFKAFGFTVIDSTALAPGKYDSYFPAKPKDAHVPHNALVVRVPSGATYLMHFKLFRNF